MKLQCFSKSFYETLINSEYKETFKKYFFIQNRNFDNMKIIEVSLPNKMSIRKNNTIWRDMGIVAKLLFCHPTHVYYQCLTAHVLKDVWLEETKDGYKFNTLSGLTDDKASESIPKVRDFLQQLVNDKYQKWIHINWSCKENKNKPDVEL